MRTTVESTHLTTLITRKLRCDGKTQESKHSCADLARSKKFEPRRRGTINTGGIFCPRPLHIFSSYHKSPTQNFVGFVNLPPPFPPSPLLDHSSTLQWIFKQNLLNHLFSCLFAQPKLCHMENDQIAKRIPTFRSQTVIYCLTGI